MSIRKDWAGQKIGKLTFIRATVKKRMWEALCECGKTTIVRPGGTRSCGCGGHVRKHTPVMSTAHRVWKNYKSDGLSFDDFYRLSQQNCNYCGTAPNQKRNDYTSNPAYGEKQRIEGDFTYNGLDRVDSSKGHTPDNVVPCCWECNDMKGTLTLEDFKIHIRRIFAHLFTP
jgi:hypothetical protein